MSLVDKYLNINNDITLYNRLGLDNLNLNQYSLFYKEYSIKPYTVIDKTMQILINYIDNYYNKINLIGAEINYYIQHINILVNQKFSKIIVELNIDHIISMIDYCDNQKTNYKHYREEYYKYIFNKIINGKYTPANYKISCHLNQLINDNWNKIKFNNIIELSQSLNLIKFFGQNINIFSIIIDNKFDDKNNIIKLLDYIINNFVTNDENSNYDFNNDENIKFNFRFIIDNLKSNGFLLFEEYFIQLKQRYKQNININLLKKDKKLINYFMYIVSQKDSNSVNRIVNEILIKIKDYLHDLEDSYNNTIAYQQIIIKQESNKYKNIDLSSFNRKNSSFNIFKYSTMSQKIINKFKLNNKIEPYFDIYKSYYNSKYNDREVEFDILQSTLIIKMTFLEKNYFIDLAVIQYIVLDIIYNSHDGINILDISNQTDIEIVNLENTINSLLKIKIIKSLEGASLDSIKFFINKEFTFDKEKISISSLVINENNKNNENVKEFLHDRIIIVLSNLYDYVKKNKFFVKDVLINDLQYKIPFKIDMNHIDQAVEIAIKKEHIKQIDVPNINNESSQIMYQYIE